MAGLQSHECFSGLWFSSCGFCGNGGSVGVCVWVGIEVCVDVSDIVP